MSQNPAQGLSELLSRAGNGDKIAVDALMPHVYAELRARAARYLQAERTNHTLHTTALVNEVYLKLVDGPGVRWEERNQFLALAATCMRHILVDHARAKNAAKRGGGDARVTLGDLAETELGAPAELVALDAALSRLARVDERRARAVELHYFGGLEHKQIAQLLDVSAGTVERDLRLARAWLRREVLRDDES